MAKVITPEQVEKLKRASVCWIEFYDGELGRSTALFAAMKCKDGTLVDEECSIYDDFKADTTPDAEGDCWRFWDAKPTAQERKNTRWEFEE